MKKKTETKNSYFIELPLISGENKGNLCFGEVKKQIPFEIKRFFYIFDLRSAEIRGEHAHKNTEQVLFCLKGSAKVELDDGINKETIVLTEPNIGLFLGKMLWVKMTDFKKDTVLLSLCSDFYKEEDYIRNYNDFIQRF
ncbi:FdtA/QdtA family cupin domain-containing protein [Patescibacteria group bacterium]|nr:FdtA/QdtA family cupin domain-containing protein [Patescibacteria group bacterium]